MWTRLLAPGLLAVAAAGCGRRGATATPPTSTPSASSAASTRAPAASASARGEPAPTAPAAALPRVTDTFPTRTGELSVVPVHHATLLFEHRGQTVWVDPSSEGKLDALPRATFVFLTHDHPDHYDPEGIAKVRGPATVVVAPPALASRIPGAFPLRAGEIRQYDGFTAEAVAAYDGRRAASGDRLAHPRGSGVGYLFDFAGERVYVAGDAACTPEVRALRGVDVAFVSPALAAPDGGASCLDAVGASVVFPYHHRGTDRDALAALFPARPGVEIRLRDWY
jgi:L-ascorbate metabolism protein UlaG (beta-lactamase superfamily)